MLVFGLIRVHFPDFKFSLFYSVFYSVILSVIFWGVCFLSFFLHFILKLIEISFQRYMNPFQKGIFELLPFVTYPVPDTKYGRLIFRACLTDSENKTPIFGTSLPKYIIEAWHGISNNVVCATSKGSDQPAHTRSLIRAFASRLNILRV